MPSLQGGRSWHSWQTQLFDLQQHRLHLPGARQVLGEVGHRFVATSSQSLTERGECKMGREVPVLYAVSASGALVMTAKGREVAKSDSHKFLDFLRHHFNEQLENQLIGDERRVAEMSRDMVVSRMNEISPRQNTSTPGRPSNGRPSAQQSEHHEYNRLVEEIRSACNALRTYPTPYGRWFLAVKGETLKPGDVETRFFMQKNGFLLIESHGYQVDETVERGVAVNFVSRGTYNQAKFSIHDLRLILDGLNEALRRESQTHGR